MTVKQISVFVENKPGKLLDIVRILKKENIDMRALSIGETSDYGILRLIVDKPDEAVSSLTEGGFVCSITPVVAIRIPDEPGSLEKVLSLLAESGISIEYTYAFLMNEKNSACLVIRVQDNEKTIEILQKNQIELFNGKIFI